MKNEIITVGKTHFVICPHCHKPVVITNENNHIFNYQKGISWLCNDCIKGLKVATVKDDDGFTKVRQGVEKGNGWYHVQVLHYNESVMTNRSLLANNFDITNHKNGGVTIESSVAYGFNSHSAQIRQLRNHELVGVQTLKLYNENTPADTSRLKYSLKAINERFSYIDKHFMSVDGNFVTFNFKFENAKEYQKMVHKCRKLYQLLVKTNYCAKDFIRKCEIGGLVEIDCNDLFTVLGE